MKKFILLIFLLYTLPSFSDVYSQQYCIPGRFDTTYCFTESQVQTDFNINYGSNTDWQGNTVQLNYIIAYPKPEFDTLSKRPFMLLTHGGGFLAGDKLEMAGVMMDFALRGYVCASIDYRTGWDAVGGPFSCMGSGYSLAQAVYRAMQDSKAALRYFSANANLYKIDTANIFAGGISAGAVTSLLITYNSQADMNLYYPNFPAELGLLDNASNSYTNQFKIKCVISSSGAVNDVNFIRSTNAVPTMMFHGTADMNVPYNTGYVYSCSNYLSTLGSAKIVERLRALKRPFELDYVPGGGHENFYPLDFIAKRSIIFLKRYLCDDARQIVMENFSVQSDVSLGSFTPVIPTIITLYQNYPNPFNPATTIEYSIPFDSRVSLKVYDVSGRFIAELVNGFETAGTYQVNFNASSLSSGVFFYSLVTESNGEKIKNTKKMIFIK